MHTRLCIHRDVYLCTCARGWPAGGGRRGGPGAGRAGPVAAVRNLVRVREEERAHRAGARGGGCSARRGEDGAAGGDAGGRGAPAGRRGAQVSGRPRGMRSLRGSAMPRPAADAAASTCRAARLGLGLQRRAAGRGSWERGLGRPGRSGEAAAGACVEAEPSPGRPQPGTPGAFPASRPARRPQACPCGAQVSGKLFPALGRGELGVLGCPGLSGKCPRVPGRSHQLVFLALDR